MVGVGWYVGFCIVIGVWGGHWIDVKLSTNVLFTMLGLFGGLAAAGYGVYRMLFPSGGGKD
jgi:hypothetical protein